MPEALRNYVSDGVEKRPVFLQVVSKRCIWEGDTPWSRHDERLSVTAARPEPRPPYFEITTTQTRRKGRSTASPETGREAPAAVWSG